MPDRIPLTQGRRTWDRLVRILAAAPAATFLLLFVLLPVAILVIASLRMAGGPAGLETGLLGPSLGAQVARGAFRNSLVQGALSSLFAVLWGYPAGLFVGRWAFPGRRAFLSLLLVPFLLPSLVMVLGIEELFGAQGWLGVLLPSLQILGSGLPGIVLVNVLYNAPIVALFTANSVRGIPRHMEEAAAVLGARPHRIFGTVWARPSLRGAGMGALLTFLFSFLGFAAPLILGGPAQYTVEDWIYALYKLVGFQGPILASDLAVWTLGFLAVPVVVYAFLSRGTILWSRTGAAGTAPPPPRARTWGWGVGAAATLALALLETGLLAAILLASVRGTTGTWSLSDWSLLLSPRATGAVGISVGAALGNTFLFALLVAGITVGIAIPMGLPSLRRSAAGDWLRGASFLPLLVSPIILALAVWTFWGPTLGAPGTLWMLIVASQATLALPFVLQAVGSSFRGQPQTYLDAAKTLGSGPWGVLRDVVAPLARPALVTSALFALAMSFGEFAATNFLYIPQYATLVVMMYGMEGHRLFPAAEALGALLVLVTLAAFGALVHGGEVSGAR